MAGGTVSGFRVPLDNIEHAYLVSGPFLTVFDTFWGRFTGRLWHFLDHFGTKIGSFWGDFGPFLGRSGVILGSLWDHFGIVLASFWGRFVVVLTPFSGLFGVVFDPLGGFSAFFGQKPVILRGLGSKKCIETLKPYFGEDT